MASAIRPMLLRHTALSAATRRVATAPMSSAFLSRSSIQSPIVKNAARVAAFHASSRRSLLPPGPQILEGTINDAAPVPDPKPTAGSYHWTFERLMAAGLIPLTVAPFAGGSLNPALDATLCAVLLIHSHGGLQSILIDYVPTRRFPKTYKTFSWMLNIFAVMVGIGLYEFETNDVGLTETIKRVWRA